MAKIPGGYILSARKIWRGKIADCPPHFREIWNYLLFAVNHEDAICKGQPIKRGQCVRSYNDIIEGLSWHVGYRKQTYKKHHCEKAMKWLMKEHMVTTTKTTRGMLITICNYDHYQTPENYESDNGSDKKATRKRQWSDTINKNDKNDKNEKNVINTFNDWQQYTADSLKILLADKKWIEKMEKYYPGVNIEITTKIAFESYFSTPACYKNRKGSPDCNWKTAMYYQLGPKGGNRVFNGNKTETPDYSNMP